MQKTVANNTIKEVDNYLASQPENVRLLLEKIRKTIKETAPDSEEIISYKMPAYRYHGMLVYFAGFKNHCSIFMASKKIIEEFKEELKGFKLSKGTIQFTVEKPLPLSLIKKMIKVRMNDNLSKVKKKG